MEREKKKTKKQNKKIKIKEVKTTQDIDIPKDPFELIIGQDKAVSFAKICANQKRHLLLVGVPGTGKSMIAQAIAYSIPKPKEQILLEENQQNPDRPKLIIERKDEIENEKKEISLPKYDYVPINKMSVTVLEKLGYICKRCGDTSSPDESICPNCGYSKNEDFHNPFGDLLSNGNFKKRDEQKIKVYITLHSITQEYYVLKGTKECVRIIKVKDYEEWRRKNIKGKKKTLVPFSRNTFVMASGASESELLGDVKHDPYGDHRELGSPAHTRVVPGAIHEAHEGVLFIDEIPTLKNLQRNILTAMQEKIYPIVGRSTTSTGSTVKIKDVPCNFVFVGACNISDISEIMPQLRNRITGNGYELLLRHYFEKNEKNKQKLFQFIAQEIKKDGRIPHATIESCEKICEIASDFAKKIDGMTNAYTLRLRTLSGIIKLAGDMAKIDNSKFILPKHIDEALKYSKPIEVQINENFPNWWKRESADKGNFIDTKPDSSIS